MGKYVMHKNDKGNWRFNLKAGNGETILSSEEYNSKAACENGIQSVKINSPIDARYDRKISVSGQHFFNLKASNGQVIGTSEMYNSKASMDNGIESVKKNGPDSPVVEQ
jgi:uncharacterized protein YegP (UPF0339 family)